MDNIISGLSMRQAAGSGINKNSEEKFMLGNIITAIIVIVAVGSIAAAIIYKVKHKGYCGGESCSGCSVKDCPSKKK